MRHIQKYTTGSLFLMTLSAAAETWFLSKTHHGLFPSSLELMKTLFPTAMENIELFGNDNFPILWGLAASTILQFPLWSIFAISAVYFSYLLLTDSSETQMYGKDFENLQMWSKLNFEDSALYLDRRPSDDKNLEDQKAHVVNSKLEIFSHQLILDDEAAEKEDLATIINNSISEIICEDDEEHDQTESRNNLGSAYVDPKISEPVPSTDNEHLDGANNQNYYKDEIDEFDDFCAYLNYMGTQFDEEELDKLRLFKNKK